MIIRTITSSDALHGELVKLFKWSETIDLAVAWAHSANKSGRHWKGRRLDKIKRAVVGTAFAQTEPLALEILNSVPERLRLIINSRGTFHPKVILGRKGAKARAIVGSANFTKAAYTTNTELNLVLEGDAASKVFKDLRCFIDAEWGRGTRLTQRWLDKYRLDHERAKRNPFRVFGAPLEADDLEGLDKPWDEYVDLIKRQEGRPIGNGNRILVFNGGYTYFGELRRARMIFDRTSKFSEISDEHRKFLIGLGDSSGYLGRMQQAGNAKSLVINSPATIGRAIDRIPLVGEITPQMAADAVGKLTALTGVGVGVASRLLAAKRPDYFVSVNGGSKKGLQELMEGAAVGTGPGYLRLLNRVWRTEWHRAKRPTEAKAREIWDGRAALLDAAVYRDYPKKSK